MTQISILGCGWLGLPLAKTLLENGFSVKGSTTSKDKIPVLEQFGIEPFLLDLNSENSQGTIISFLEHSEILLLNIPPKLKENDNENFIKKIDTLVPFIEKSSIKKVIFASSTSIYADENVVITEETLPQPNTKNGKQLLQAEHILQNNSHFKTTIVRFGGLIGENRHPIRFLSGRENIENPETSINLIHLEDCIGIILKIIEINCWGELFNAVAPFHPSRKDYYTQKAVAMGLALPKFNLGQPSARKTISSDKIERILHYKFTQITL